MIQAFYQALQISVSLGKCIWIQPIKEEQQCAVFLLLSHAEADDVLQTQVVELLQAGRSRA